MGLRSNTFSVTLLLCRPNIATAGARLVIERSHSYGSSSQIIRLEFHQQHSGPVMDELHRWLEMQLAHKKAEPNSGVGQAITYMLRHWRGLTAFLREPNAPLDNNLCERALKRAVLHRKNALFYRTLNGARPAIYS